MKWILTLLLLAILALGAAGLALAASDRGDQPLTIAFAGFTNAYQYDRPVAMFVATNHNSRPLRYMAHVETKTGDSWPVYFGPLPHNESPIVVVPAWTTFSLLRAVPAGDTPWRLSLAYGVDETTLRKMRWRMAEFFYNHNWTGLGRPIHKGAQGYIAVSPEIRNIRTP